MKRNFRDEFARQINLHSTKYKLAKSKYGYYSLRPMPTEKELSEFYKKEYLNSRPIGVDIGTKDKLERFYFDRAYEEIERFIQYAFKNKKIKILDVGCGTGFLLRYLRNKGYHNLYGTELCPGINETDIRIFNCGFLDFEADIKFDFITLNCVLEHVREPESFLKKANRLLKKGGFIRVQVPNDLTYLQFKVTKSQKNPKFYFLSPQHLHYFNFISIQRMLESNGFRVVKRTTNWCMDIFILMGIDYSKEPPLGKLCHNYRKNFEYKVKSEFLLKFYEKLAELEIGRDVIEYAKKI